MLNTANIFYFILFYSSTHDMKLADIGKTLPLS